MLLLLAVSLCSCASQRDLWLAHTIVTAGSEHTEQITLKLRNNAIAGNVNRSVVTMLLETNAGIDKVARVKTTLYITNRGQARPNAYAAYVNNEHIVAINFKMIEMLAADPAMCAALIGHEVAHHVLQHRVGTSLIDNGFSKDQEMEADKLGIKLMFQAGYPLRGALAFYEKLTRDSGHTLSFLSSHPGRKERLEHVKKMITWLEVNEE